MTAPAHAPVYPTQRVFRTLLEAMSHPGRICPFPFSDANRPWSVPYLAVAVTLLDHEVSFHVLAPDGGSTMAEEIFAATKARHTGIEDADYIFIDGAGSKGRITSAKTGSPDYPDQGATAVYVLPKPDASLFGASSPIVLEGPGIRHSICPALAGLLPEELESIGQLNGEYPLGVDCFFLGPNHEVMALPRSVKIRIV